MRNLNNFYIHVARPYVDVIVSAIFVRDHMLVWCSLFDIDNETVKAVYQLFLLAYVARLYNCFSLTLTLSALNLNVLHKSRHDLLLLNCDTLTFAFFA